MTLSLHLGFYGHGIPFSGHTPAQRDLGGAEYCVVSMAEALARRGHTVTVFSHDSQEAYQGRECLTCNGVTYFPLERAWRSVCHATQFDVFVISRAYELLSNSVIQSKLLCLWNHDILTDPDSFREHIGRADKIYCLSDYHKSQYLRQLTDEVTGKCTLQDDAINVTRNGIDVAAITKALAHIQDHSLAGGWRTGYAGKYNDPTFVYCSRPERGLLYLLRDIWPQIVDRIPTARLKVAFYDVSAEQLPEPIRFIHRQCYALLRSTPQVDFMGSLPRSDLFQVIAASWAMLYPSIFPEVSCLSILEAQALGTPVLTSKRGALVESNWTDDHQIFDWEKVERGDSAHAADCADWIMGFVNYYWSEGEVAERGVVQTTIYETYDWNVIAEEWEGDFLQHFIQRSTTKAKRVIQNLIYHSDLLAARWALINDEIAAQWTFSVDEAQDLTDEVGALLRYHHVDPEMYADSCGDTHENILTCPDRMKVALDLIEQKFGHDKPFRLLDIGVGAGRFLYHVLRNFHNCQVMGFDFSLELCVQARRNLTDAFPALKEDLSFIQHCDVLELDLPTEEMQADVIFCGEYLEHQTELVKAMTVVDAWCKEGGLVIYTTPYGPWEAISFGSQHTDDGHEIRAHVSHFEHRDFAEMFREVPYRLQATYIQHSPLDNSVIGNFVLSYEKPDRGTTIAQQFYSPDYHRKFLTTRPYVRVGALLITKDAEDHITRALKPLMKRVDHLLCYDTGSTDKTIELATPYCQEVVKGYWDDDFGEARNRALDFLLQQDVDWVLWFDSDEEMHNAQRIRHYLQGDLNVYAGAIIFQNSVMIDALMTRDIPVRLFRANPSYRFLGCCHEQVEDMTDPTGNTDPFPIIILPDVQIVHYGFVTEQTRRGKAIHRNFELVKKDRQMHPERLLGLLMLLRDYLHHVKWHHIEDRHPLRPKDIELLHFIIDAYGQFETVGGLRQILARQFHDEACEILGKAHEVGPQGIVPLNTAFMLAGIYGPLPETEFQPQLRWFSSLAQFNRYVAQETLALVVRLERPRHIFED